MKRLLLTSAAAILLLASLNGLMRSRSRSEPEDRVDLKVWYESYNENYFLGALPADTVVVYGNIWPIWA